LKVSVVARTWRHVRQGAQEGDFLTCLVTVAKQEVPRNISEDGSFPGSFVEQSGKASVVVFRTYALHNKIWVGYVGLVTISAKSNAVPA
jgi:hypothetical protein